MELNASNLKSYGGDDMFAENEFRAELARKGYTQKSLAEEIGMSPKTLHLKMKSGKFGTDEVERIMEVLKIHNPIPIFFAQE